MKAGLQRAQAEQAAGKVRRDAQGRRLKAIGRPKISGATEAAIRARLASGVGMLNVAHELGVGSGTVQRVKREMAASGEHSKVGHPQSAVRSDGAGWLSRTSRSFSPVQPNGKVWPIPD